MNFQNQEFSAEQIERCISRIWSILQLGPYGIPKDFFYPYIKDALIKHLPTMSVDDVWDELSKSPFQPPIGFKPFLEEAIGYGRDLLKISDQQIEVCISRVWGILKLSPYSLPEEEVFPCIKDALITHLPRLSLQCIWGQLQKSRFNPPIEFKPFLEKALDIGRDLLKSPQ